MRRLQKLPAQRPSALAEGFGFNAHVAEHCDEEIAQRLVVFLIVSNVLAMLESSAREEDREITGMVSVSIAEVAAEHN